MLNIIITPTFSNTEIPGQFCIPKKNIKEKQYIPVPDILLFLWS